MVAPSALHAPIAPNDELISLPSQLTTFKSTKAATGLAVSSMLNVIRATFKQSTLQVDSNEETQENRREQNPGPVNTSSASRGRGIKRN